MDWLYELIALHDSLDKKAKPVIIVIVLITSNIRITT